VQKQVELGGGGDVVKGFERTCHVGKVQKSAGRQQAYRLQATG
jgi:hypothetical protein